MAKATCTVDGCDRPARTKGMCKPCYRKDYYRRNRERTLAINKAWREANPDRMRELVRSWDSAHVDRKRAVSDIWRKANADRVHEADVAWRNANPEKVKAASAKYQKANADRVSMWKRDGHSLRRARIREQSAGPVDYAAILAEHGMVCHICLDVIASLSDLQMDHVIPLSKGGPHAAENIRPSHALCNLRKGAKIASPEEAS
jgi:5-methylcytosine-specific restriction endonuclease McrA